MRRESQLAGGGHVEPDAVICATGYRRGLEPLVGHLDVLGPGGTPRAVGEDPAAPGLRFIGFVPRPGQLGHSGQAGQARGEGDRGRARCRRCAPRRETTGVAG